MSFSIPHIQSGLEKKIARSAKRRMTFLVATINISSCPSKKTKQMRDGWLIYRPSRALGDVVMQNTWDAWSWKPWFHFLVHLCLPSTLLTVKNTKGWRGTEYLLAATKRSERFTITGNQFVKLPTLCPRATIELGEGRNTEGRIRPLLIEGDRQFDDNIYILYWQRERHGCGKIVVWILHQTNLESSKSIETLEMIEKLHSCLKRRNCGRKRALVAKIIMGVENFK